MAFTYFFADGGYGRFDEVRGGPVTFSAADIEDEIADDLWSKRGVVNLGMELHCPDFRFFIGDTSERVGGDGGAMEAGG